MMALALFDTTLGGLCTDLFAHTTLESMWARRNFSAHPRPVVGLFQGHRVGDRVLCLPVERLTPNIRAWLSEKVALGAESQVCLVEAISEIQTVKALAVESPLQR